MRFRSLLMFACMIVVPMLAMFSHKLPPEVRDACSRIVLNPAIELIESLARPAEAEESDPDLAFAAAPAGPLLAGGTSSTPPQAAALREPSVPPAPFGQLPQPAAGRQPLSPDQTPVLRRQLAAAGVQRLLIEPAGDGSRSVRGSCRLAVDTEGQLQRLFHANGTTEAETLQRLLEQVGRWNRRLAAQPPYGGSQTFQR